MSEIPTLITNCEVHSFLKKQNEQKVERPRSVGFRLENLYTVEFECLEYLKETPAATQTTQSVAKFLKKLEKVELTRAEKLQIVNTRPRSIVDLYVVIEYC